jgi:uncharacterized repeat protein (TIGR03803 family)
MSRSPQLRISLPISACIVLRTGVLTLAGIVATQACLAASLATLVSFNGSNGEFPYASLISDHSGNLYGTTFGGGTSGKGTIFHLDTASATLSTLASFAGVNGAFPSTKLMIDAAGNLLGTTEQGGFANWGTIYRLEPNTNTLTSLASFDFTNGAYPVAALISDPTGNLYGTTYNGGIDASGTVFRLDANHAISALVSFSGPIGRYPAAGLTADSAGTFYGTTSDGGAGLYGTIFQFDAMTNEITTLAEFNGINGGSPWRGELIEDNEGNLYGTTEIGGASNLGTVFRLDTNTNTLTTLASFMGLNGALPNSGLIIDAAGNLYGTTLAGGSSNRGTVFRLEVGTNMLTTIVSFNGTNGASPYAGLIADAVGNLYGTTVDGGANDQGTIFSITGTRFVVPEPTTFAQYSVACLSLFGLRRRS